MKQYHEINFVRTILILLVILVHIVHFGALYPAVKEGILGFMMPSFLVVTGYLVNVEKSAKEFLVYLFRIFVPYLIMVLGFSVLSFYLPVRDGITEISAAVLLEKVFLTSIGPYWFLYVMIGCGICYYLSFRILPIGKNTFVRLLVFAALLYLVSLVLPLMAVKIVMYYFFGTALRQFKFAYNKFDNSGWIEGIFFLLFLFFTDNRDWGSIVIVLTVSSFLVFSNWLYRFLPSRFTRFTDWMGMNTLPIYLFHPVFTMFGKYYHPLFLWDKTELLYTFVTLVLSVAGSLALAYFLDRTHLTTLFARKKFFRKLD